MKNWGFGTTYNVKSIFCCIDIFLNFMPFFYTFMKGRKGL